MRVESWEEFWFRSYEEKWCITLEPDYLIAGVRSFRAWSFPSPQWPTSLLKSVHQQVPQWGWHGAELLAVAWLNMECEWAIKLYGFKPGVKKSKLCKDPDRKYFIRLLVFRQSLSTLKLSYMSLLLSCKVFFVYCRCNSHIKCIVFKYSCPIWISSFKYL